MLGVLYNDSICRILNVRRRNCVPTVEQRCRLRFASIPAKLVQRRLRWFGYAAILPNGELIRDFFVHTASYVVKANWGLG